MVLDRQLVTDPLKARVDVTAAGLFVLRQAWLNHRLIKIRQQHFIER